MGPGGDGGQVKDPEKTRSVREQDDLSVGVKDGGVFHLQGCDEPPPDNTRENEAKSQGMQAPSVPRARFPAFRGS